MPRGLRAGKIPPEMLEGLLRRIPRGPGVVAGPGVGEDAAVIDPPPGLLIAKTDPITFADERLGWYALHVNANDIFAMGGEPRWFLAALLLPEGTTRARLRALFDDLVRAAKDLGVSLVGGHTEIVAGLPEPIVVGQMLGIAPPGEAILNARARPGQAIILAGGVAIEGSAIIASAAPAAIERAAGRTHARRARRFLVDPGLSVRPAQRAILRAARPSALHDPTDGGLRGAVVELATAARAGCVLEEDATPVLPACRAIADALEIDPLSLIASGALLAVVDEGDVERVLASLRDAGIAGARIGELRPARERIRARRRGRLVPLRAPREDEIARFWREIHPKL
ncbi:MAG: hydrogenase expression protein [Planctomycetes bacterium]|nr:hydrogenase expression protein [Planctomycetota bacterium]